jgi:hypothetical protein
MDSIPVESERAGACPDVARSVSAARSCSFNFKINNDSAKYLQGVSFSQFAVL